MKTTIKTSFILLFILLSVLLCGCNAVSDSVKENKHTAQIFALDTVIDITAYGENAQKAVDAAKKTIQNMDKLLSVTNKESDIYKLNHSKGKMCRVSEETYHILTTAKELCHNTDGKFDITIYPILKLWGFTTDKENVPSQKEIDEKLSTVSSDHIVFSDANTVILNKNTEIDLGGIAKGYVADKAAQSMRDAGAEYGIISLGGNVRTVGSKPSGESWTVGIQHPDSEDYFAILSVGECSVITSGAYQRNFTKDGKTYHHIIDPKTGYPAESDAKSVTIIGDDGTVCDALSTALFIGGSEYAHNLRQLRDDFEYVILTKDNRIVASKGIEGKLLIEDDFKDLEIEYK